VPHQIGRSPMKRNCAVSFHRKVADVAIVAVIGRCISVLSMNARARVGVFSV
jgi:hypothetical protein